MGENLNNLAVLDLSDNRLSSLQGVERLRGLKALIAARNRIFRVEALCAKKQPLLETLVLSHNKIEECSLVGFEHLKKVSLGHNKLTKFPKLDKLPALSELRILMTKVPSLPLAKTPKARFEILNNKRQSGEIGKKRNKPKQVVPMEVNGRSFEGSKQTFADSDDEGQGERC